MEVSGSTNDLRELQIFAIFAVLAQAFLLCVLSWNKVAIVVCIIFDIFFAVVYLIDWCYLRKKLILDEHGCTFVSGKIAKRFTWDKIYQQHVENATFFFGDSEIPGEGVILSAKPISKPTNIGAMTYCRFTNPCTSVFIRFTPPVNSSKRTAAKFVYEGFVADKREVLSLLSTVGNSGDRGDGAVVP